MKYVATVDLEHRVWLEAEVVVDVTDGVEVNEAKLSNAIENQILDLISAEQLMLNVTDIEFPQFIRVRWVTGCEDSSRESQIQLAAGADGSLVDQIITK